MLLVVVVCGLPEICNQQLLGYVMHLHSVMIRTVMPLNAGVSDLCQSVIWWNRESTSYVGFENKASVASDCFD